MKHPECWTNYRPVDLDPKKSIVPEIITAIVAIPVLYVILIIFLSL